MTQEVPAEPAGAGPEDGRAVAPARGPREIVDLPTGIPAFVGPTAWARDEAGASLTLRPTAVTSLAELEARFGPPRADPIEVEMVEDASGAFLVTSCRAPVVPSRLLHHAVAHFFANGGARCWIVSTGDHEAPLALGGADGPGLLDGLAALAADAEPELLVLPDAIGLSSENHAELARAMLAHCAAGRRRFAVLDVRDGLAALDAPGLAANRELFGEADLDRGAAYYPFLRTSWAPLAAEDETTGTSNVTIRLQRASGATTAVDLVALRTGTPPPGEGGDPSPPVGGMPPLPAAYAAARSAIAELRLVLPPSGAVAGIYALTDATQGVWKPPANVALEAVEAPAVAVDAALQERLNVDLASGRSIDAIRAFTGRGTVVWGARTLAGNSSDWRYVPVRRLLAMVESSIARATAWAALEPNDVALWTELRGIVERYLVEKWRQGALAGATPREAFFVQCGLGTTMTQDDIDSGRLVLEIGVAPVRPAEFVILRIGHALQPSPPPGP